MNSKCCVQLCGFTSVPVPCDPAKSFRLEERYEYHKGETLRLLDLKRKFPMSNIRQIARLMHKTADEVKEDIFGIHFSKNNHRCFDKMRRDIM